MSKIIGALSYKENLELKEDMFSSMFDSLKSRGDKNKEFNTYLNKEVVVLGEEGSFYKYKFNQYEYVISLDGFIFNKEELKEELKENGFDFNTSLDSEVIIKLFIAYGERMFEKLNGVYSFVLFDGKNKCIYLVKDVFGIKPLYYTKVNDMFLVSSEIKGILGSKIIKPVLDKRGLEEFISLSPDHINGNTLYKNIYELKNASFLKISKLENSVFGFDIKEHIYWKIKEYEHTDSLEETAKKVRSLIDESIYNNVILNKNVGAMLSGGLDSSILVWIVSKMYKDINKESFKTFSVKYKDNNKHFVKNDFEQSEDSEYIKLMVDKLSLNHTEIEIDTPELFDSLEDALIARDMPGMADIDSSLYVFSKRIKESVDTVISGECSDEIFGGYPWYFKDTTFDNFPWSNAIIERQNLLNKNIRDKLNINVKNIIKGVCDYELDGINNGYKKKTYLTMKYFMQTLIDRSDRMSSHNGLNIVVPFCDKKIAEYMWNIPWEMKCLGGREKGLLRYAYKDILPEEIVYRKKSPYPKTFNPSYMLKVKEKLLEILNNDKSKIHNLFDKEFILELVLNDREDFKVPWFGQLMRKPQFMAYIITVNMWLEKYNIEIDI